MSRGIRRRVLIRALEIVDREELARLLGARRMQMDRWLGGFSELPDKYFMKAVEICLDRNAPPLWGQQHSADWPPKALH